jgi:hypothetical protein
MRLIQNLRISWVTIFYGENTCKGKVIYYKKMIWPIRTLLDPSIGP